MSLTELETLHQLCELERTQILQSLALAVLKIRYAVHLLSGTRSNFFEYEGNMLWYYTCTKKVSLLYVFEDKRCYKKIPIFYKNKVHFVDTLFRRTNFWDTAILCGSENSHKRVQLNRDDDKYHLLTPYATLVQPLKKLSPESIRAIARTLILIYNQSVCDLNPTSNITFEHSNFKNHSPERTQHNDNP